MDFQFSELAQKSLIPSAINQLTSEFAEDFREGVDINLGVGYVNDKTIPTEAIQQAYSEIIADPVRYRNALNYGGADGSPNLRQSIKEYYLKYNIGSLNETDFKNRKILIGANGATSILDSIADTMTPGIVITADPYYYIYTETLERKGFKILAIPEDENGLKTDVLEEQLKNVDPKQISFFYIVTVNNPSTVILSTDRKRAIVKIAERLSKETNQIIPVVFDKAYEDIIHNPELMDTVSGLKFDQINQVVEIGTLSKILAPALRIGYIITPNNALADILTQRTSDIGFSNSLINQEIASWLLDHYIQIQKENVNKGYQIKADFIKQMFDKHLSQYIESYSGGDAAFYFYITFKNIKTNKGSKFFNFLSRITGDPQVDGINEKNPRLIYIPGTICSKEPKAEYQLRLSYGFEEPDIFERAIQLMAEACEYAIK